MNDCNRVHVLRQEEMVKPSELLTAAQDYLMEHGWCKNHLRQHGRVCALGALVDANPATRGTCSIEPVAAHQCLYDAVGTIPYWNNHPDRTFNEVMDGFDRAIILAKEREA